MSDEISDVDLAKNCGNELDSIPVLNHHDLDAALKELKSAAASARNDERRGPVPSMGQSLHDVDSSDYDWMDERFEPFFERMSAVPEAMAAHAQTAKESIQSGQMSAFGNVATAVERWGGDAQEHYKKYFVDTLPQAVTNQQGALDELSAGLLAYAAVLRQGRINAIDIANETTKSLEALEGGGSEGAPIVFAVIAAAAGVAAAIPSGGTSVTITLAVISGGAGVAGSLSSLEDKPELTISGGTVEEILENMQNALNDLQQEIEDAEKGIGLEWQASADTIEGYLTNTTSNLEKATILPHEPANDDVPNLTNGGGNVSSDPEDGDFRPRT